MHILVILTKGEYGQRHLANIQKQKPESWEIHTWQAAERYPLIIDYPEDHLPASLAPADLILSFAENKSVAELLPDIAQMTGAKGVIVAVDNENWLPRGLARQLTGWLEHIGVACATPKPLCSLTQTDYKITRKERQTYECPQISEFARYFGQPRLNVEVNPENRTIQSTRIEVDAVCGCARHVAAGIVGLSIDDVEEKAGLLHHHYPCLASMVKLNDYNHDTLMHESAHILVDDIREQIKPFKQTRYFKPGKLSE
jgi:thymidylate synthase